MKEKIYFGRKHVETGLSCSHKLPTFLEYHMPLRTIFLIQRNFLISDEIDLFK